MRHKHTDACPLLSEPPSDILLGARIGGVCEQLIGRPELDQLPGAIRAVHQEKGSVNIDTKKGIFRHWEPIDDSFVGEGIVIDPKVVKSALDHRSKAADQSQILVITAPKNSTLTYYVGFAWTGSAQVQSVQDWEVMLEKQAQIIQNPLLVTIK